MLVYMRGLVLATLGSSCAGTPDDAVSDEGLDAGWVEAECGEGLAGSLAPGASWQYESGSDWTLDEHEGSSIEYDGSFEGGNSDGSVPVTYGRRRSLRCGEAGLHLAREEYEWWIAWDVDTFDPPILWVPRDPAVGMEWESVSTYEFTSDYALGPWEMTVRGEVTGMRDHPVAGTCAVIHLAAEGWEREFCFAPGVGVAEESDETLLTYEP